MATPITWNEANFNWDNNPHTWDEVQLVIEAVEALGGGGVIEDDMPWMKNQDKKKRLIKLICKVQGKTIKEEKEIQDYKIKISDIKLLAEKVLGIEVLTENIKF
jgi:hypothetical protein|tara:strand:+ start:138 stop:449 length:312 start_codon:yes stop_codon:yes gene_type:complete